jgi:hypothetical protein
MITLIDMETGKIVAQSGRATTATSRAVSTASPEVG